MLSSQAGFVAKGAETTTQFPEINLQEKVSQNLYFALVKNIQLTVQNNQPFCFRTGQTMTRKLASQWASMKSHISLSSVESIGDGAQMLWLDIQQRKRDFIQGTFIKFNKNTLIVVVEIVNGCVWGEQARTFTT